MIGAIDLRTSIILLKPSITVARKQLCGSCQSLRRLHFFFEYFTDVVTGISGSFLRSSPRAKTVRLNCICGIECSCDSHDIIFVVWYVVEFKWQLVS